MKPSTDHISDSVTSALCPECGSDQVSTEVRSERFTYGEGRKAADLNVELPVRACRTCTFEFFDEEAELLKHEAVCEHLRVMTPREVRALRAAAGLTRAQFAELTGLGTATLARWESGILIQNTGYDRYLRLLRSADNLERLRNLLAHEEVAAPRFNPGKFTALAQGRQRTAQREAGSFELVKRAS